MATVFTFDGRNIKLPGAYSTIKSGINNPPAQASYGNVLIIDTGSGANFGGGAGINGTLANGQDAVYQFDNIDTFRSFIKGGIWWLLADPLFKPEISAQGVSRIYFAKAATTVPAEMTFAPTGGGYGGGNFVFQVKDEGLIGNGVESSSILTKGYAYTFHIGEKDPSKFLLKFWVGTFKGDAADGIPYDGIEQVDCAPQLLLKSIEFDDISDLITWAEGDSAFNIYFKIKTKTVSGTGAVDSDDLTTITGNQLAIGGTESYADSTDLDKVLDAVKDLEYRFTLSDRYGDDAKDTEPGKILTHIETEAKFTKFMVVGGGLDKTKFNLDITGSLITNSSADIAIYYNSARVIVVHSGVKKASQYIGTGFREWNSLYHAAAVTGRLAGLPPQIPLTFKSLAIDGVLHPMNDKEKEQALDNGILATYYDDDFKKFTVLQGINSLQRNSYLINSDGTSFSTQLMNIAAQLNNELVINSKKELLGQQNGVNRNTLSAAYIRDWTIGYLKSRVANEQQDNLIISFQDVTVTLEQDAYKVTYAFVPNTEITKLFFTGFMIQ